ncbi:MAG: hypothetical protein HC782_03665 [Gammaproteobacteria bacterium]|nr:hypothetical protein [Gammaproteobacteria bacterium]
MKRTQALNTLIAFSLSFSLFVVSTATFAHTSDCAKKSGMEKLRCERHVEMAKKCGPIKGDAHFVCDRAFLLANPISCKSLTDKALVACDAEQKAFKLCEPNLGRDFMKCVKTTTGESPMGH